MTNPSKATSLRTKLSLIPRRAKVRTAQTRAIAATAVTVVTTITAATATMAAMVVPMLVMAISLTACSSHSSEAQAEVIDYNSVCDVNISGWHEADSLIYPIIVTSPASIRYPLQVGLPYTLSYNIRITPRFGFASVPMLLMVQQTDTLPGGHLHVVRNILRQEINPAVRDSVGRPLGGTWGSLIDYEAPLSDVTLRFDSVGTYRMILTPLPGSNSQLSGIASVGLLLTRRRP